VLRRFPLRKQHRAFDRTEAHVDQDGLHRRGREDAARLLDRRVRLRCLPEREVRARDGLQHADREQAGQRARARLRQCLLLARQFLQCACGRARVAARDVELQQRDPAPGIDDRIAHVAQPVPCSAAAAKTLRTSRNGKTYAIVHESIWPAATRGPPGRRTPANSGRLSERK
jgi:hypothetical protein